MADRAWFLDDEGRGEDVARGIAGAVVGRSAAEIGDGVLGRAAVIGERRLPDGAADVARAIAEIARDIAALVDAGLITLEHDDDGQLRARPTTDPTSDSERAFFGSG